MNWSKVKSPQGLSSMKITMKSSKELNFVKVRLYPPVNTVDNKQQPFRKYNFDKVFGQHSSQREVFEQLQVSYLVKRVIEVAYNF